MVERWLVMDRLTSEGFIKNFEFLPSLESGPTHLPPSLHEPPSDIWVYITLALIAVSCVGCVCSCILYHKFQQWKHHEMSGALGSGVETPRLREPDEESLPSYTLVTGLPSYEQAVEQLKLATKKQDISPLSVSQLISSYQSPEIPVNVKS